MPRKKKKAVAKRRVQAAAKKKRKSKPEKKPPVSHRITFEKRPPFSDIEAPEGFRAISASQSIMEFAKPVLDQFENPDINELNELITIGTLIWNYEISLRKPEVPPTESENEIIQRIAEKLGFDKTEARNFFKSMLERKEYLFPAAIQPENPMIEFIRKEQDIRIEAFDYGKLAFTEKRVLPDAEDLEMINSVLQLDKYLLTDTSYDDWEDHFFTVQENCEARYRKWLVDKGLQDYSVVFSGSVPIFLDFVYLYMHDNPCVLSNITKNLLEEFFFDFIIRKWGAEPGEYVTCPPALKMFYTFLYEKGYLGDPKPFVEKINRIETQFINILKRRYES